MGREFRPLATLGVTEGGRRFHGLGTQRRRAGGPSMGLVQRRRAALPWAWYATEAGGASMGLGNGRPFDRLREERRGDRLPFELGANVGVGLVGSRRETRYTGGYLED